MAGSASASRVLLEGEVLHIGFHGVGKASYPEDVVPAAVLRAVAQYLKVDLGTEGVFWGDYCWFAGVTGEAFRFLELMGLYAGNPGLPMTERYGHMTVEGMYRRALDAAGLAAEVHLKPRLPDEGALRPMVVESLRERRMPVIGFGAFGPPEPFLITGHDEDGDVLLGWSHFQGSHDTVYEIWETAAKTGPFDPDLCKFRDPARRRTMAGPRGV